MYKYVVLMTLWCACVVQRGMCYMEEGDPCVSSSGNGICKKASECPEFKEELKKGLKPKICGFIGKMSIVCCYTKPSATPKLPDSNESSEEVFPETECEPIPPAASKVQKTGRKAWDKCIDYLEYVYPCEEPQTLVLISEKVRTYKCSHDVTGLVVGGSDTSDKEFPHMALLGYGPNENTAQWDCGGTVVSENYIMTAGHCTFARDHGKVTFVRVGMTKMNDTSPIEQQRIYRVAEIIKHPEYESPSYYNDLALLKTAMPIKLDDRVYPACLHTGNPINDDRMLATGWGSPNYMGSKSNTLQKVTLEKFTSEECMDFPYTNRNLEHGLFPEKQLCAGHHKKAKDTCQGDSGGPLQIFNQDVKCMYTVVGITSFGLGCGLIGAPGVYTRVSYYLTWIESIVWP